MKNGRENGRGGEQCVQCVQDVKLYYHFEGVTSICATRAPLFLHNSPPFNKNTDTTLFSHWYNPTT